MNSIETGNLYMDKDYFKDFYMEDLLDDNGSSGNIVEDTNTSRSTGIDDRHPYYVTFGSRVGWICPSCGSSNAPIMLKCDCVTEFK